MPNNEEIEQKIKAAKARERRKAEAMENRAISFIQHPALAERYFRYAAEAWGAAGDASRRDGCLVAAADLAALRQEDTEE